MNLVLAIKINSLLRPHFFQSRGWSLKRNFMVYGYRISIQRVVSKAELHGLWIPYFNQVNTQATINHVLPIGRGVRVLMWLRSGEDDPSMVNSGYSTI